MLAKKALSATAGAPKLYVEDVMSCFLYTGNGSTQTITNNIDLSGEGGLLWIKQRNAIASNFLYDSARSWDSGGYVISNTTGAAAEAGLGYISVSGTGFSLPSSVFNESPNTFASWTFRKAEKFFDVVTYTGDNTSSKAISHNLGSVPGCVIVKRTDSTSHWFVWHRSTSGTPNNDYTLLNQTAATAVATNAWSSNAFTSTQFYVSNNLSTNVSGATYVAYVFAHNAGGFGLTGSDNVISCGSFTSNSLGQASITLGYEPQWVMIKRTDGLSDWTMLDNMRGWAVTLSGDAALQANNANAETSGTEWGWPTATGFFANVPTANSTWIYIAIRRGPMKTPTTGTSVFSPNISSGSVGTVITTNFPVDMQINSVRNITSDKNVVDRLRGVITTPTDTLAARLRTNLTNAEGDNFYSRGWNNTGFQMPTTIADASDVFWSFRRAPGFFDVVCYTGTGSARTVSHNLGVVPELMIVKNRSDALDWAVYSAATGNAQGLNLNVNVIVSSVNWWDSTTPTSTTFRVSSDSIVNGNGQNLVAYLFATSPGVSKVGSYSGNGTDRVINCGFTTGARFVLIKCTSNTGNWTVWDSARGITSGNDPLIALNLTSSENPNTDFVNTDSTGFYLTTNAVTGFNEIGRSYLFLAIA